MLDLIYGRTVTQQTIDRECLKKFDLPLAYTHRIERTDIQGTQFDIFYASPPERLRGALPAVRNALRPDRAVILVLDLQEIDIELPIFLADFNPDFLVGRVWRADSLG